MAFNLPAKVPLTNKFAVLHHEHYSICEPSEFFGLVLCLGSLAPHMMIGLLGSAPIIERILIIPSGIHTLRVPKVVESSLRLKN